MTPQQSEILQVSYELAFESIMRPHNLNPQIATRSLRIFMVAAKRKAEIDTAKAVLAALDHLVAAACEDRRSRIWQDRKLQVQAAFSHLEHAYDQER
jgi:hypothetical protein